MVSLALALALALPGCDSASDAVASSEKAASDASKQALDSSKKAAGDLSDSAVDASKKAAGDLTDSAVDASKKAAGTAVDASKKAAGDLVDATTSGAKALFTDVRTDGELSDSAKTWIRAQADDDDDATVESLLVKGVQLAPVALEAAKVLVEATDSETAIEPIFQEIGSDTAKTDEAIAGMPRVEAIDGLTIGFKQMDTLDASKKIEQRGYLVMWRHENHLVGFVYRSTRTVDLDMLVAAAPRLAKLTQKALEE